MKRDPPVEHRRQVAVRFWPWLLWHECMKCRNEFRREWGWKMKRFIAPEMLEVRAVCAECCPAEPEAYKAITGYAT